MGPLHLMTRRAFGPRLQQRQRDARTQARDQIPRANLHEIDNLRDQGECAVDFKT